jgi:hypothetical protein
MYGPKFNKRTAEEKKIIGPGRGKSKHPRKAIIFTVP